MSSKRNNPNTGNNFRMVKMASFWIQLWPKHPKNKYKLVRHPDTIKTAPIHYQTTFHHLNASALFGSFDQRSVDVQWFVFDYE